MSERPDMMVMGKHEPDPKECSRCWDQARDPLHQRAMELVGGTPKLIEHIESIVDQMLEER